MNNKINILLRSGLAVSILFSSLSPLASDTSKLKETINAKHRTESYVQRDQFRHPLETLKFFGIKDHMTVVELSPGSGWYTEILAPYLMENGTYIAAGYDPESTSEYFRKNAKKFTEKLKAEPAIYGKAVVKIMQPPEKMNFAKDGSADMVLSFRNTHNWHSRGHSEQVYSTIFKALRPGGILGLVQHRAGEKFPLDSTGKFGYLKQSDVIALAKKVGFQLVATSEVNANPKDTKNYEKGVWTLPPVYRMGEANKEKYKAIGESDRMTLKFIKPLK